MNVELLLAIITDPLTVLSTHSTTQVSTNIGTYDHCWYLLFLTHKVIHVWGSNACVEETQTWVVGVGYLYQRCVVDCKGAIKSLGGRGGRAGGAAGEAGCHAHPRRAPVVCSMPI